MYEHNNTVNNISFIRDGHERFCIVDVSKCAEDALVLSNSQQILKCRFCKSLLAFAPMDINYACPVCKCFNSVPQNFAGLLPKEQPSLFISDATIMPSDLNKMRILLVYQTSLGGHFANGLLCLADIV